MPDEILRAVKNDKTIDRPYSTAYMRLKLRWEQMCDELSSAFLGNVSVVYAIEKDPDLLQGPHLPADGDLNNTAIVKLIKNMLISGWSKPDIMEYDITDLDLNLGRPVCLDDLCSRCMSNDEPLLLAHGHFCSFCIHHYSEEAIDFN